MDQRLLSIEMPVEELLAGHYAFSIPPFQRDYAWSRDEALLLLDDIVAAVDDSGRGQDTPYFLGTMLFVAPELAPETARQNALGVDVIDGQQRLITLSILFAVLRDLAEDPDERDQLNRLIAARPPLTYPYQLRLRDADESFFASAILAPGAARKRPTPASAYTGDLGRTNIELNRRALHQRLAKETPAQRSKIAEFARQRTRVLVVTTDDFDYAYQIFLTINDRGKRLTVEDIFRGQILGPLDADQRERYSMIVEQMDRYMDADEKRRAKGKTFFTHLLSAYGWSGRAIVTGLREAVARRGGPKRFAAEVFAPLADAYLTIKSAGANQPEGKLSPEVRHWLTALAWLERHGDDDWVGVAMLGLARLDPAGPELPRFLAALDRFAHGLVALGCGRPARQSFYAPIAKVLAGPELPEDPAALLVLPDAAESKIVKMLATRLHIGDAQLARLVLIRLDAALSGRELAHYEPLLDPELPRAERLTVEHVLPKGNVKADSQWDVLFPRRVRRAAIAQCIGNLVLISEAANRGADRQVFAAKKKAYFGSGAPQPHRLALTEALREVAEWDNATIAARYDLLMQTVHKLWRFEGPVPPYPGGS